MSNETKNFSTAAIASLSTGILLCDSFSSVHEAAEFLMGHPIWTHQFASKELCSDMTTAIAKQCPGMPTEMSGVTSENYRDRVAELESRFGKFVTIRKGDGLTAMAPTDGIPDHLKDKTIFIATD